MFELLKVFLPGVASFVIGVMATPFLSAFLYKHKMWKKKSVALSMSGDSATITAKLHNDEERKTPRMGGVIVWGSTLITALLFTLLAEYIPAFKNNAFDFLSRNQTWLPLAVLVFGGLIGLIDDYLVCREKGGYVGGGLSLKIRLLCVGGVATLTAWWFFSKLDIAHIAIPFYGDFFLGWLFIPLFVLITIGIYSGGIIDGIDGLSGGVFSAIFLAYTIIAFGNGQYDLGALCMAIVGSLLAFLWFNIPPARFFNSETGTMALTTALVTIAFMTNAVVPLFVIALPLIITSASSIIQILSKKFRNGKKVFVVAPLHNHFQAIGWPSYKVTMRYWIASIMFAISGVILYFLS